MFPIDSAEIVLTEAVFGGGTDLACPMIRARSLTRRNCAGFGDDALTGVAMCTSLISNPG